MHAFAIPMFLQSDFRTSYAVLWQFTHVFLLLTDEQMSTICSISYSSIMIMRHINSHIFKVSIIYQKEHD